MIAFTAWQAWRFSAGSKIGMGCGWAAEVGKLGVLGVVPGRVERPGFDADVPTDLTGEPGLDPGLVVLILTDRDQLYGNGPLLWTFGLQAGTARRPSLVARSLRARMWGLIWGNKGQGGGAECGHVIRRSGETDECPVPTNLSHLSCLIESGPVSLNLVRFTDLSH